MMKAGLNAPNAESDTGRDFERESQAALYRILSVSLEPIGLTRKFDAILDILFGISWLGIEHKGAVFLTDRRGDRLLMVSSRSLNPVLADLCAEVPYGRCLCGKAAATRTMVFRDHLNHEHDTLYDGIADHGHYCQPIMANGLLLGVLNLYVPAGYAERRDERAFLQSVADTLAGAIERERIDEERQRLILVVEESPDFIGIADIGGRPLYFNRAARELLGCRDAADADACSIDGMFVDASARRVADEGIPMAWASGQWRGETSVRRADGSELPVSQTILAPPDETSRPRFVASICHDISDRKKVEQTLQTLALHEQQFANAIINSLPGIFFTLNEAGRICRWNVNMERNLGYPAERLAQMTLLDLVDEVDAVRIQQAVEQADAGCGVTLEVGLRTVGGIPVAYLVSTTVIGASYGGGMSVVGVGFDISERKALELELERQASVDYLTGAYNRRKFAAFLNHECARALRYGRPFAVVMFDIDHFKAVNDTYGHDIGDRVLCEVVRRARGCVRKSDVFARWGGEEFVVLLPESQLDQAAQLAEKMRVALGESAMAVAGQVTASFGVVEYRPAEPLHDMTKRLDEALYRAKERGRDCVEVGHA